MCEQQAREAEVAITALHRRLDDLARVEVDRTLAGLRHLSAADRQAIERFGQALVDGIGDHLTRRIHALPADDAIPPRAGLAALAWLQSDAPRRAS